MKQFLPALIAILLISSAFAADLDVDLDGNGKVELKDAIILRDVLADKITCPEDKRCDVNKDGSMTGDDYAALVAIVKGTAGEVKGDEPEEEQIPEGDTITVDLEDKFVMRLYDTANLASGDLEMKFTRIRQIVCRGNASCPQAAVVVIGGENQSIAEGSAKTVSGYKIFLQNINNKNNSVWTITQTAKSCDGCKINDVCIPEGRDEGLSVFCKGGIASVLRKDGDSCLVDDECLDSACVDSACKKSTQPVTTQTPKEIPTSTTPAQTQSTPDIKIEPQQQGLFSRLWSWFKSLF